MKFLFLEPFFGGSHKDFAEGLAAHSRHRIDLVTLPARFWITYPLSMDVHFGFTDITTGLAATRLLFNSRISTGCARAMW